MKRLNICYCFSHGSLNSQLTPNSHKHQNNWQNNIIKATTTKKEKINNWFSPFFAESQGFEPWVPLRVHRFSRPTRSTTLATFLIKPCYFGLTKILFFSKKIIFWAGFFSIKSKKKQTHTYHTDYGANHMLWFNFFIEHYSRRPYNKNRHQSH